MKTAHSIKTFDFSTLFTNLSLGVIYASLIISLIIKMFLCSKYLAIMVNSNSKRAFWSNGSNYAWYREYAIYKLLEAWERVLLDTYLQFNWSIFKQILGLLIGGNASHLIADIYVSWCEYCYTTKVLNTDYALAKLLSYNCKYLDDICTVSIFVTLPKTYSTTHCYWKVVPIVTNKTPFWIFISVLLITNS